MKRLFYILPLLMLLATSCRDIQASISGEIVIAEVGDKRLTSSELARHVPKEYRGEDSVAFVEVYIDKWIRRSIKLREAERLFSADQADIEQLVSAYREQLLIRRLDEQCVLASVDTIYTDEQIASYYGRNSTNFRLRSDIVRAEVVRVPLKSDQAKKVLGLMSSKDESKRLDFLSICEKNHFEYIDYTSAWVESSQLLDLLPYARGSESEKVLLQKGVKQAKDEHYNYYYQIVELKRAGDVAPLEWVRSTIRTVLITERQQSLIRQNEQSLYYDAVFDGVIKLAY